MHKNENTQNLHSFLALAFFRGICLKGLSHEIDFKNIVENGQILALIRAAAGFLIFRRLL
jgi:hypothetical protein